MRRPPILQLHEEGHEIQSNVLPRLVEMDTLDEEIFKTYTTMASLDTGSKKDALRKKWREMKDRRDEMVKHVPNFDKAYGATEGRSREIPRISAKRFRVVF